MTEIRGNMQLKADLMMLIATLCWGSSYLFFKMGLETIEPLNLIFIRFTIGFLVAGAIFYRRILRVDGTTMKYSFILGTILFIAFAAITFALKTTSVSNAGFLVCLSVVFVPLISSFILKEKLSRKLLVGVCFAFSGIGMLTLNSQLTLTLGDILCILCAFFYAIHIILTSKFTKYVDSISLGVLQLGFCALWGLIFSFIFETPKLPETTNAWISVLALGIVCSALGFTIQSIAQKYTTPTHTGLIFSFEPISAALFAYIFIGETLTLQGYIGATIVIIGILIAELDFRKLFQKKNRLKQTA